MCRFLWPLYSLNVLHLCENSYTYFCSATITKVDVGFVVVLYEIWEAIDKNNMDYSENSVCKPLYVWFHPAHVGDFFLGNSISLALAKKDDFRGSQVQVYVFIPKSLRLTIFTGVLPDIKGNLFIYSHFLFMYLLLAEKLSLFS